MSISKRISFNYEANYIKNCVSFYSMENADRHYAMRMVKTKKPAGAKRNIPTPKRVHQKIKLLDEATQRQKKQILAQVQTTET